MCCLFVQQWKKDDNEPGWLVIVRNPSKEKKMTMSFVSSSSSIAHQKKRRWWQTKDKLGSPSSSERMNKKMTKTKPNKKMMNISSSLSSLGAQKQNKRRWRQVPTLIFSKCTIKNKKRQWQTSARHHLLSVHRKKTKKDDKKCWLVVVFS